jgi:hypothetical protein
MNSASPLPVWVARPLPDPAEAGVVTSPAGIDAEWLPLGQPWQTGEPGPAFQAGWARVRWHETALHYDAVFMGGGAHNSARQLNERTWELGDVGEIFVQAGAGSGYLEVHVTPENARLQLHWSADGLARVRGKVAALGEFMIAQPDWVQSRTHQAKKFWAIHVAIPAARFALDRLHAGQLLRTAVCRYDYRTPEPVLSSTAPLPVPFFHHRDRWHSLLLSS